MRDNAKKDVLMNPEECEWTDKEIDTFIPKDALIEINVSNVVILLEFLIGNL